MRNEQSIIGGVEGATSIDGAVADLDYEGVVVVPAAQGLVYYPVC